MAENIFEELHTKKQKLISLVSKAKEFKWFDSDEIKNKKRADEIIEKINNDTLVIGVIGQMKCGKSTFLNSFVFEDDVLPAATTPMTAALSVITYGETKELEAEFYTEQEWQEQLEQSKLSEDGRNEIEASKIKAAKELVEKSSKLGSSLRQYLGKTQKDSFENLIEYVGADGKYISITKSVTIKYPKEYLKGVQIVDTPGFNDPIVSREERTKAFLKKADAVLMMLYAGRPFDSTDRTILFENVRQCGSGKVLIGINKYDIPYGNGEQEEEIKNYVKQELRKASNQYHDSSLSDILKETEPVPLSAEMALLSELDVEKINSSEAYKFSWKRYTDTFEDIPQIINGSSQKQMRLFSKIDSLIDLVKDTVSKEKERILFAKPVSAIKEAGSKKLESLLKEFKDCENAIELNSMSDSEIDEKEDNLRRANKKLTRKIDSLSDDLKYDFENIIDEGKVKLEDDVNRACETMIGIVDNEWGMLSSYSNIQPSLEKEVDKLITRTLKRDVKQIGNDAKSKLDSVVQLFFSDAESVVHRFLPEFDTNDFVKSVQRSISFKINDESLFQTDDTDNSFDYGFWDGVYDFINGATYGLFGGITNAFSHNDIAKEVKNNINAMSSDFDANIYLDPIVENRDKVIESVRKAFIDDLLDDLQKQITDIKNHKDERLAKLNEAKAKREVLKKERETLESQIKEVESFNL